LYVSKKNIKGIQYSKDMKDKEKIDNSGQLKLPTETNDIFIFYENKKIKAIYTDKNTTKKDILNYLVDFHLKNKFASTKKECTKLLFKKILALFDPEQNYMDSMGYCWNLLKLKQNHMYDKIDTPGYKTKFTKINIKGHNVNRRDLDRDLDYLNLTQFY
jgi:hypothetical protein